jgi:hypothetical protein
LKSRSILVRVVASPAVKAIATLRGCTTALTTSKCSRHRGAGAGNTATAPRLTLSNQISGIIFYKCDSNERGPGVRSPPEAVAGFGLEPNR